MGYLTTYTICHLSGSEEDFEKLLDDIKERTGIDFMDDNVQSAKWYDYDRDLTELTKNYPGLTIGLCGDGENSDDNWTARYRDGEREYESNDTFGYFKIANDKERESFLSNVETCARRRLTEFICEMAGKEKGSMTICCNAGTLQLHLSENKQLKIISRNNENINPETLGLDDLLSIARQLNQ